MMSLISGAVEIYGLLGWKNDRAPGKNGKCKRENLYFSVSYDIGWWSMVRQLSIKAGSAFTFNEKNDFEGLVYILDLADAINTTSRSTRS
ncbi:hypothetical protein [Pseudomonas phoenicis]|uniref:hypothetical protein n=1 Tax=unclassified Pseudomonas TaxID=196821 RepID=UPI0039A224D0